MGDYKNNNPGEGSESFSLGSTVDTFAQRLKRKLKEQEEKEDVSRRAAEMRQAAILQAMTTIRKALQETSKINLGTRFSFTVEISDWEGWPRVELRLADGSAPNTIPQALMVTPNDRNEQGAIEIQLRSGEILGRVHLQEPGEVARLPFVLKRSLRHFLDLVAAYVLDPTARVQHVRAAALEAEDRAELDEIAEKLKDEDLFSQDYETNENIVKPTDDIKPVNLEPAAKSVSR